MTVYQISHWSKYFENNKSKLIDHCSHAYMPNKQDGLTFTRLMAHPQGATIFGVWCLILQACSRQGKQHRDGWLTADGHREGTPWTPEDLAFRWRRPIEEIETAMAFLSSSRIGWLKALPHNCTDDGTERAAHHPLTVQNNTIQNSTAAAPPGHDDDDHLEEQAKTGPKTDEQIFEIGNQHTRWRVTDPDVSEENRQTLIFLFRSHLELAKVLSEGHHFQTGKKINVWELEDMIAEKLRPATSPAEPVEKTVSVRLIEKHGWEACREASTCSSVKNAADMLNAMLANNEIYRLVTERFGAA